MAQVRQLAKNLPPVILSEEAGSRREAASQSKGPYELCGPMRCGNLLQPFEANALPAADIAIGVLRLRLIG